MARSLTAGMEAEVVKKFLSPIFFAKFSFDSGDLNLWNGLGVLQWNGDNWYGVGTFYSITTILETSLTKSANLAFTLSAVSAEVLQLALGQNYQGRSVKLWLGAMSSTMDLIADPYLIFKGKMDVMSIKDDAAQPTITLNVENDLVVLQRISERRWTDEDQKTYYPDDTFFSYVAGLQDANVRFGG